MLVSTRNERGKMLRRHGTAHRHPHRTQLDDEREPPSRGLAYGETHQRYGPGAIASCKLAKPAITVR
jgi:hypothetical protein